MKHKKRKKKSNLAISNLQTQTQSQQVVKINGKKEVDLNKVTTSEVGYRGKFFPDIPSYRLHSLLK